MGAEIMVPMMIRRAERHLIDRLREAGATSFYNAESLSDLRFLEEQRLRKLLAAGVIRIASTDRYFLDEEALETYSKQRRKKVLLVVGGAVAAALAIIGLSRK